jgi:pimeloyl-ACP methyl ester carboxylesterase
MVIDLGPDQKGIQKIAIDTMHARIVGTVYNRDHSKGIFLLPGTAEPRSYMHELAQVLSNDYSVWTFDLNGQGESSGKWRLPEMVESFYEVHHQLKEHYGLERLAAVGHSKGALAVGMVAAEPGSSLDSLSLLNVPTAGIDVLERLLADKALDFIPKSLVRLGSRILTSTIFTHERYETAHTGPTFGAMRIHNLADILEHVKKAPRLDEHVADILIPVQYVYAGNDLLLGFSQAHTMKELPQAYQTMIAATPRAELLFVPGADHCFNEKLTFGGTLMKGFEYVRSDILEYFKKTL